MKHKLTHNLGLKLISVLIACLIWLIVADSNDPEDTQLYRGIPVTIVNQDTITNANKTFTVVDGTDRINVYVTARRSVRSRLSSASSFTVRADLENYNEAIGSVPLEVYCSDPAVTAEDMRIQPASLKINMEDKIEESFGIVATVSGKAARGYELGRATLLTGDTIRIAGPQSLIRIIGKVTVPVDISSKSSDITQTYAIRIEDKNGAAFTEGQMAQLELKNADGVLLQDDRAEVAVEIWQVYSDIALDAQVTGQPREGYKVTEIAVSPRTVNLTGPYEEIQELGRKLTLADTFDIAGASENKEFVVDLNDTLAEYGDIRLEADVSSAVTVTVRVDVVGSKTIDIPVSEMTLLHAPAGKNLIFSPTDKLSVNVRAADEVLGSIDSSDIGAEIDLADCAENGSYTIPVTITLPPHCELGSKVSIVVNVGDEEQEAEVELPTEED